jgi:hypothetical protein
MKRKFISSNNDKPEECGKSDYAVGINRRKFIQNAGITLAGMTIMPSFARTIGTVNGSDIDVRSFLSKKLYSRKEVDDWLAGRGTQFAKYVSDVGWVLRDARWSGSVNNMLKSEGVDGATWETSFDHDKSWRRHLIAYADKPCRINTYGDSFTHCDQVNDGETWQEMLASHLREPVQNFGVGGYSVYQAYLRMLKEEKQTPSDLIIFNIFEDDHYRNIGAWGTIRAGKDWRFFWPTVPYLTVNFSTGQSEGHKNPCLTEDMVYKLCDLDWVEDRFRNDFTLGIMLAEANARAGNEDRAWQILEGTARAYGLREEFPHTGTALDAAGKLHTRAALLSSMQVVDWVEEFAKQNNKKVLYILSFGACHQGSRFDQTIVDFMDRKGVPYVDLLSAHLNEFSQFKGTMDEYYRRYWDGHYNPGGNFFTALAIRNRVVGMLNPKPPAYQPL